jgi:hypothetical protein
VKVTALENKPKPKRQPGTLKGVLPESPDSAFFDPLPEDELKLWEEGYEGDPLNESSKERPRGASS